MSKIQDIIAEVEAEARKYNPTMQEDEHDWDFMEVAADNHTDHCCDLGNWLVNLTNKLKEATKDGH